MPDAVTHPSPQELTAFGQGKLPKAAGTAVASHLEVCAACRETLAGAPTTQQAAVSPEASIPLPPDLANHPKYRMVRELGRGGMGVVYQAVHTVMDRSIAIKVINPSVLDHPDALPRFHGEVKAAAKLDHANIVRAHDADQVGDLHLLVMEFVEGKNLAELVQQKGPLTIPIACNFIRQAALGLQHAFEQGMVHRDIKPSNLMVTPRGQVKILDFGLARLRSQKAKGSSLTEVNSFMGTPEYVSPEQATDARTADTRADIYSLGCTLYYLLTGRPPFQEETVVKLVLAQIEKEPPAVHEIRSDVPPELSAVVARMLAKDPGQRYQKPVEVAQALMPFIKPGAKPGPTGVAPPPKGVASPTKATLTSADTNKLQELPKDAAVKPPSKVALAREKEEAPFEQIKDAIAFPKRSKKGHMAPPTPAVWWKRPLVLAGAGAAVLLLILAGLWASGVFKVKTKDGILVLQVNEPRPDVFVDDDKMTINWDNGGKEAEIHLKPGTKKIELKKDGFTPHTEGVTLEEGGRQIIIARLDPLRQPGTMRSSAPQTTDSRHFGPSPEGNWEKESTPPVTAAPVRIKELPPTRSEARPAAVVELPPAKTAAAPARPKPVTIANSSRMDLSTDSYASGIKRDKEVYEAALKTAAEKLLAAFDRELGILPKAKMKPEERLKLIDVVKAEKVAFQNRGRIPWSAPMRVAMHEYLNTMIKSRRQLARAFDKAMDFYMESDNAKSKAYSAWKLEALRPIVLSAWNYTWAPGKNARWEFFSDGTIGGGPVTWSLDKGIVVLKAADAKVKGGYWIDTCKLARDGKTMSGANQLGHRKSGQLLED